MKSQLELAVEKHLRAVLRVLAAEPADQEQAYAPFCPVRELPSEFDHWSGVWLGSYAPADAVVRRNALAAIEAGLDALSEAERACSDPELLDSPGWTRVRKASRGALLAFGWSRLPLPRQIKTSKGIYREETE